MSRQYENYTATEHRTRLVSKTCDMCGKVCESMDVDNWTKEAFEVMETTVELKQGSRYPDNSNITTTSFDICPDCFETKLVPFVASTRGARPTITETEW